jgi:DNA polymerase-3 subunit delta'
MINSNLYPWQEDAWKLLNTDKQRMHHALLLRGQSGIGKLDFATNFAKSLLCNSPAADHQPCRACPSCGWFEQDNHPDFRQITPEQDADKDEDSSTKAKGGKKSQISVAQIRSLGDFLSLSSHQKSGVRIVLIHPAETLNKASANALLKMLEEPPADVLFILVSHQPHKLLPTILSRCQKIDMPIPNQVEALSWMQLAGIENAAERLRYAGGSPLLAASQDGEGAQMAILSKELLRGRQLNVFNATSTLMALGMENAINALQKWAYDLMLSASIDQVRYHVEYAVDLNKLSKMLTLDQYFLFQEKLIEAKKSAAHPLNQELQLEALLLHYTQLFKTKNAS